MDFAKEIRVRRAELRLSQQDIADACKTTKQNISKYESGKSKDPDYRLLKEIYTYLGLDSSVFNEFVGKSHAATPVSTPSNDNVDYRIEIELLKQEISQLRIQVLQLAKR